MQSMASFSRYIPADRQAREWGWRLVDAGKQHCPPGSAYPGEGHPQGYLFDAQGRRMLDEFQLILITEGSGSFESASQPKANVGPGTAFLLFPGEWHRYSPSVATGWQEYWLGFQGREAQRLMQTFFAPESPLLQGFDMSALVYHFERLLALLEQPLTGREQVLASHVPLALALVRARVWSASSSPLSESELVARAKEALTRHPQERVDLEKLARKLGVSYSRLRLAFKRQTGVSPRAYENEARLNRACDLLLRREQSVSMVAEQLGYASLFYFSRSFKKHVGLSPQTWLQKQGKYEAYRE